MENQIKTFLERFLQLENIKSNRDIITIELNSFIRDNFTGIYNWKVDIQNNKIFNISHLRLTLLNL